MKSYERAISAQEKGIFKREVVGVETKRGLVLQDEEPTKFNKKKIFTLKPVFDKDPLKGTITGANASKINDGACSLLLVSEKVLKKKQLKPLVEIIGFADAEVEPENFNCAPAFAIKKVLGKLNLDKEDIDFWEINEAFSLTPLVTAKILGLDLNRINLNGGAVSLGHPVGMSGARILLSLLSVLRERGGKLGCAAICNGGGGATCLVVRNLQ